MNSERGAALVVALAVLIIVSSLAVGLAAAVRRSLSGAAGDYHRMALLQAAKGGVNLARAVLAEDDPAHDSLDEDWAALQDELTELPDGSRLVVQIEDLSSRLNVNTATMDMLSSLPGMNQEMVDCLLDWRDSDEQPRGQGAEREFYETLDPPYEPANGRLETVDELLVVKGWTPTLLYQPQEPERSELPLADLLSVRGGERDVNAQGQARLNLNTATADQLQRRLGPLVGAGLVTALVAYREQRGLFVSLGDLFALPGATPQDAVILDEVTVAPSAGIRNTVNVNTAPAAVLAALPGSDEGLAQAIIDRRESDQGPFETKGDLIDVMSADQLEQMIDHVSTRSALWLVTVTARPAGGPGYRTIEAVVQRTADSSTVLSWREVFRALPLPPGAEDEESQ